MSRKRYTPEQIIRMLREAEVLIRRGMTATEAARQRRGWVRLKATSRELHIAGIRKKVNYFGGGPAADRAG